jgi:hypothetical protein
VDEAADRCGVLGVYSFLPAICAPVETHANQVASLATHVNHVASLATHVNHVASLATHTNFSSIVYQLLIELLKILLPRYSYLRYL